MKKINKNETPHCPKCKIPALTFNKTSGRLYCPVCQITIINKYIILNAVMEKAGWYKETHSFPSVKLVEKVYHKEGIEISEIELMKILDMFKKLNIGNFI